MRTLLPFLSQSRRHRLLARQHQASAGLPTKPALTTSTLATSVCVVGAANAFQTPRGMWPGR